MRWSSLLLIFCCTTGWSQEVISFVYHRFGDNRYPSTNISMDTFEQQLIELKKTGLPVLTISDALEFKQNRAVCITIDDGYKSFYTHAYPLLKSYGFTATIYVNTKSVGADDYMSWSELRQLANEGFEIGNHTHAHDYFLNIPETSRNAAFAESLKKAHTQIADKTGITPATMAYPYGEFDIGMTNVVKSVGYNAGLAQNSGVMSNKADAYQLPRFPMTDRYADSFSEKLKMHAMNIESKEIVLKGTLILKVHDVDLQSLNCFSSMPCSVEVISNENKLVRIVTDIPHQRRVLQTITGRSASGWHWYSHLWVIPEINE